MMFMLQWSNKNQCPTLEQEGLTNCTHKSGSGREGGEGATLLGIGTSRKSNQISSPLSAEESTDFVTALQRITSWFRSNYASYRGSVTGARRSAESQLQR